MQLVNGNICDQGRTTRRLARERHFPLVFPDGHVLRHSIERVRLKEPLVPEAVKQKIAAGLAVLNGCSCEHKSFEVA